MSACRYDSDAKDYLIDGEPCRRDEYGDPTKHCTARRTCSNHIGRDELTCARCIGRTRQDIRQIAILAPLMLPAALGGGVDSEAANLAGPGADYRVFSARRVISRQWIIANLPERRWGQAMEALLDDDDEQHPYSLLTRWQLMLAEDYGHPLPARLSVSDAAAYLDRHLHTVAQDPEQDFPLLRGEMRRCRQHMESVLRNSTGPERGAPCPECREQGHVVRLAREYGHWCTDADCEQIHYETDEGDRWVCSRNKAHVWSHAAYENYVEERKMGA